MELNVAENLLGGETQVENCFDVLNKAISALYLLMQNSDRVNWQLKWYVSFGLAAYENIDYEKPHKIYVQ